MECLAAASGEVLDCKTPSLTPPFTEKTVASYGGPHGQETNFLGIYLNKSY